MSKCVFSSLLLLLAGSGLALGKIEMTIEPVPPPQPAAASAPATPQAPAPGDQTATQSQAQTGGATGTENPNGTPWNPPVGRANIFPYPEAVQVGIPDCKPPGDFWLVPEYLLWSIKGFHVPPLATSGSAVVGPGSELGGRPFSGGRFTAGTWLDDDHSCGFEGSFFFLGDDIQRFDAFATGGDGSPVLARPYLDTLTGRPAALVVGAPGLGPALLHTDAKSLLQGAEADLVADVTCCAAYRVELKAGFRYQDLSEDLDVGSVGPLATGFRPRPVRTGVALDQFGDHNIFYGGELGMRAEYHWGCWFGSLMGEIALGSNQETVNIVGTTVEPGRRRPIVLNGGLLALPSNEGRFEHGEFSAIPELGLQAGYQFNPWFRAFVGYTFLYWFDVVRPGDQVDLGITPAESPALHGVRRVVVPGPAPFTPQLTNFWAQGLSVGAEVRY
jgi:hypothetical protein